MTHPKNTQTFQFSPPSAVSSLSDIANAAIQLGSLAEKLSQEDRTICRHPNGRPENVSEHSHMLAVVAPAIAEEFYPYLDANLIARYAAIHDAVEAYVGDTPTFRLDDNGFKKKDELEQAGLQQLKNDYAHLPKFVHLVEQYELQLIPEARFVRMVDKWTTLLLHFAEGGKSLVAEVSKDELLDNLQQHALKYKRQYSDFIDLIEVREELLHYAVQCFYAETK